MNFFNNGWIVQDVSSKAVKPNKFVYNGVNAFDSYPLMHINNQECRKISGEQTMKCIGNDKFQMLEFINNQDLLRRYILMCQNENIEIRILFIQSDYADEICNDISFEHMQFLGYEYCSVPIDEQIITDLDLCEKLQ